MRTGTLLAATAALTLLLGFVWTLVPAVMLNAWDVPAAPSTVYMARRFGVMFFGYAAIFWLSRKSPSFPLLAGGLVVATLMTIVTLAGLLTRTVGPAAWSAFAIEALLSAAFARATFTNGRTKP